MKLRISGAFHRPLVARAAERLRPELEASDWAEPAPPFMSTVTAKLEDAERIGGILVEQLTAPVRFTQAVRGLVRDGVGTFVEIGPGQVLAASSSAIDRSLRTISVGDPGVAAQAARSAPAA